MKTLTAAIVIALLAGVATPVAASAAPAKTEMQSRPVTAVAAPTTAISPAVRMGVLPINLAQSATGQYEWVCIGTDGNAWSMPAGTKLKFCTGVALQKYLDGRLLATYQLKYTGGPTGHQVLSEACAMAVVGGFVLILFPASGAVEWFVQGTLESVPILECVA